MVGEDEDYGSARITITLDDSGIVRDARDLGIRIQRALDRATRNVGDQIRRNIQRGLNAASVTVRVDPDLRRFDAQLVNGLRSLDSINVPVAPDLTGFVERIRALLAGDEVSIRVVPDLDDFDARIRAHRAPDVTVNANADTDRLTRALRGLGGAAGGVGRALAGVLRLGVLATAVTGAAGAVAGLVSALAPAAGAIAALPAAAGAAQVAMGTLRLATLGVGDALEAAFGGDAAKFEKALQNLAPAAQDAARAFRDLVPELRAVQQQVQQAFFQQLAGQIEGAVRNLTPLREGLSGVATEFGRA
ncbi:hypothetical protein AB4Z54_21885, partial [Streptomyces sp. MCAF7]